MARLNERPVLTVVVPAYNSEVYLGRCLDSLVGVDRVEVLVVNDGSTDRTAEIAADYARRHPQVRVACQANGGHGGAVNTGVAQAQGDWIKVVDSDDWVDGTALSALIDTLRAFGANGTGPDLVVCNFSYDKEGRRHPFLQHNRRALPPGRVVSWDDIGRFPFGRYLSMHALVYRLRVLRDCGLELPRHTFYVDNLYAFIPLRGVRTLYYLDANLYHYAIGRPDQSVNEQVMISRMEQQLRVNRLLLAELAARWRDPVLPPPLRRYLLHYAEIVTLVSAVLLTRSGEPEHLTAKAELFRWLSLTDKELGRWFQRRPLVRLVNLPQTIGRPLAALCYRAAHRVFGFN